MGHSSCVGASPDITRYHLAAIRKQVQYYMVSRVLNVFERFDPFRIRLVDMVNSCEFMAILGHSIPVRTISDQGGWKPL